MENKTKLTPEELSAIRSAAGRKGGLARKRDENKVERVQMQVKRIDRDVLMRYAGKKGMTMTDAFHFLMRVILQNHPEIKKPDGWVD